MPGSAAGSAPVDSDRGAALSPDKVSDWLTTAEGHAWLNERRGAQLSYRTGFFSIKEDDETEQYGPGALDCLGFRWWPCYRPVQDGTTLRLVAVAGDQEPDPTRI